MASSRTKYDECRFKNDTIRSARPLSFNTSKYYAKNCKECLPGAGLNISKKGLDYMKANGTMADLESVLTGREYFDTGCVENQPPSLNQFSQINFKNCPITMEPESSRLTHPSYIYRGTAFDVTNIPLHFDPQCHPAFGNNIGINTQLQARDQHVGTIYKSSLLK